MPSNITSSPSSKTYDAAKAPAFQPHNPLSGRKFERSQSAPAGLDWGRGGSVSFHASDPLTTANSEKLGHQTSIGSEAQTAPEKMREKAQASRKKAVKKIVLASLGSAFLATTFLAVALVCPVLLVFVAPITVYGAIHLWGKLSQAWTDKAQANKIIAETQKSYPEETPVQGQHADDDAQSFHTAKSNTSRASLSSGLQEPQKSTQLTPSRSASLATEALENSGHFPESSENIMETLNKKVNQFVVSKSEHNDSKAKLLAQEQEIKTSIGAGIEKLQNIKQGFSAASKLTTREEASLDTSIALLQERLEEVAPRS